MYRLLLILSRTLLISLLAVTLAACNDVFEDADTFCECEQTQEFDVKLHFEVHFTDTIHFQSRAAADMHQRCTFYAFKRTSEDTRGYARYGSTPDLIFQYDFEDTSYADRSVDMVLSEGTWDMLVWLDYIDVANNYNYYDCTDFTAISINEAQGHRGCDDYRDTMRGSTSFTIDESTDHDITVVIDMERPTAKYTFITTDINEFTEKVLKTSRADTPQKAPVNYNDYTIRFFYTGFMPSAFNMLNDRPSDAITGVYYDGKITQISDTEAEIGFDYVFVNSSDSSVAVAVAVYDRNGDLVSVTPTYEVPLMRNQHTIVRGRFLTSTAGGAAAINSEFSGDYNIKI